MNMQKIGAVLLAAFVAALVALPCAAWAEHLSGASGWTVTFKEGGQNGVMQDNYSAEEWADDLGELQPGDDITFQVGLVHEHGTSADWYMANEVLKSLEEGVAEGSAYGYRLAYVNPKGEERVLFDSTKVGGDDTTGLLEATNALDEFFYLDTLEKGQTAQVTLKVSLDGETEGNAYFDTLAQLKMKFAVELRSTDTPGNPSKPGAPTNPGHPSVRTGDDTNLFPFYVAMVVSGVLLAALGAAALRARRKQQVQDGGER